MNHCRRCQSDYEKPGTCNCFAEKAVEQSNGDWVSYEPCPHCGQWTHGAHLCYGYYPTLTASTFRITPNGVFGPGGHQQ